MEYKEYSKISIHNHFGGLNADRKLNERFNKNIIFDYKKIKEQLKDAKKNKFDLLAYTNSNNFSVQGYLCIKKMAKLLNIEVLPGIEMSIKDNKKKKYLHLVVIFDPTANLIKIEQDINSAIFKNKENFLTIGQLIKIIMKRKVILIPHGLKHNDRGSGTNVAQLKEIIAMDEAIPILLEDNKTFHKEQLKLKIESELVEKEVKWIDKTAVVSCADRISFSDIEDPTYLWGEPNFSNLLFGAIMQGSRIKRKNEIIEKTSYISKIEILPKKSDSQIEKEEINCSHGLNTIIGKSGSGKTLLLNAIMKILTGKDLTVKSSSSKNQYDGIYKDVEINLYDIENNKIDIDRKWEIFEGKNLYSEILQVYGGGKKEIIAKFNLAVDDSIMRSRFEKFTFKINDYVSKKIKYNDIRKETEQLLFNYKSDIKFLAENETDNSKIITYLIDQKISSQISKLEKNIFEVDTDLLNVDKNFENINLLLEKYGMESEKKDLRTCKKRIINKINIEKSKLKIEKIKLEKSFIIKHEIYKHVNNYNKNSGAKLERIQKRKQSILKYIEQIKYNLEELKKIKVCNHVPVLSEADFEKSIKLEKSEIARIVIDSIKLKFGKKDDKDDYVKIFSNNIGSPSSKINKAKFEQDALDLRKQDSIFKFLEVFVNEKYNDQIYISMDYNNYINYEIQLKINKKEYENIETMSAGELAKTYISNMLDDQLEKSGSNLIILFDQPDNNLEKSFILEDLTDKINELRNNFQVFITTHEPILVVNADSNNIIKATNNKSAMSSKNRIKYERLSFVEKNYSKTKMVDEIAKLVDGSPIAISKRNKIYGGMKDED